MSQIIIPGRDGRKRYLVRFENGVSVVAESESIGNAPSEAQLALLSRLPPGTDPAQLVRPVAVQLMENVCAVCGARFAKDGCLEFEPPKGNASVLCLGCVEAVCLAAYKLGEQKEQVASN